MRYLVEVNLADAVDGVGEVVLDVRGDVAAGEERKIAVAQDQCDAGGVVGGVGLCYFEAFDGCVDVAGEAFNLLLRRHAVEPYRGELSVRVIL